MKLKAAWAGNIPPLYEIFEVVNMSKTLVQVTEPGVKDHIDRIFEALMSDPETRDKQFLMVETRRTITHANFDTRALQAAMQSTDGKPQ